MAPPPRRRPVSRSSSRLAANPPYAAHGHDTVRPGVSQRHRQRVAFSPAGSHIVVELSRAPAQQPRFDVVRQSTTRGRAIPEENLGNRFFSSVLIRNVRPSISATFGPRPFDLPADHGNLRRIDFGLQPPRARRGTGGRPRAGRTLHHPRAGRQFAEMSAAGACHQRGVEAGQELARGAVARPLGLGQVRPGAAPGRKSPVLA